MNLSKIFFIVALGFWTYGAAMFYHGMNPLLRPAYVVTTLIAVSIFCFWGHRLFRTRRAN